MSLLFKNEYKLAFILIFCFALFWRFINFTDRLLLSQDQGRDSIIGLYALREGIVPPLGPPSSVGPFSFGPIYYYLIIVFTKIFYFSYLAPWIGFTILSAFTVIIFLYFGKRLFNINFAIIIGLIAAFSPKEVQNSVNLLNPALVSITTVAIFYCLVKLMSDKKLIFALLLGLFVGFAINFHLQALGLLSIIFFGAIFNDFNFKKKIFIAEIMVFGVCIAFLPLLVFDFFHGGAWVKGVIFYLTLGQYKFYVPIRWLTEVIYFWPLFWGEVISNLPYIGYFLVPTFCITLLVAFKTHTKFSKEWLVIFLTFIVQIFLLRYYHGARLSVYLIVYYPFIIFFTSWCLWKIYSFNKTIGVMLMTLVLFISASSNIKIIYTNDHLPIFSSIDKELTEKVLGKIDFYQYKASGNISMPLFYLLYWNEKISDSGYKVGICENALIKNSIGGSYYNCPNNINVLVQKGSYIAYDLNDLSRIKIKHIGFEKITAKGVYESLFINYPNRSKQIDMF